MISIHAAREGGDGEKLKSGLGGAAFQSTPPVKAATVAYARKNIYCGISIHAAREGGDELADSGIAVTSISIHAAREGGDAAVHTDNQYPTYFNPRRP